MLRSHSTVQQVGPSRRQEFVSTPSRHSRRLPRQQFSSASQNCSEHPRSAQIYKPRLPLMPERSRSVVYETSGQEPHRGHLHATLCFAPLTRMAARSIHADRVEVPQAASLFPAGPLRHSTTEPSTRTDRHHPTTRRQPQDAYYPACNTTTPPVAPRAVPHQTEPASHLKFQSSTPVDRC